MEQFEKVIKHICFTYISAHIRVYTQYYKQLFHKYRSDIKMTWTSILEIICKSSSKRNESDKIISESKTITNKTEICNVFNCFFSDAEPELADKISTENKKGYETYLKSVL